MRLVLLGVLAVKRIEVDVITSCFELICEINVLDSFDCIVHLLLETSTVCTNLPSLAESHTALQSRYS